MFWSDLVRSAQHSQSRRSFRQTALCRNEQYRQEGKKHSRHRFARKLGSSAQIQLHPKPEIDALGLANLTGCIRAFVIGRASSQVDSVVVFAPGAQFASAALQW